MSYRYVLVMSCRYVLVMSYRYVLVMSCRYVLVMSYRYVLVMSCLDMTTSFILQRYTYFITPHILSSYFCLRFNPVKGLM